MYDQEAIKKYYDGAEFWGVSMNDASRYVETHPDEFKLKTKEYVIKIVLVTKERSGGE